jgi:hypothetical protein
MKLQSVLLVAFAGIRFVASGHPSSGIVVTDQGEVYFVHSGKGVAKIEMNGKLTYVKVSTGGHWLCLDRAGSFSRTQPKFFERITPEGKKPAILFADGGAPLAVGHDGNLYYGSNWRGSDDHPPGGLTVSRLSPDGKLAHVSALLKETLLRLGEGVTGLAFGPDGLLYVTSPGSIFRVEMSGSISTLVSNVVVKECDENLPPNWRSPGFRGLAVATNGTVYAAATGCRCAVALSNGEVKTILRSESPWSPTDIALHATDVYLLEWTHPNGSAEDGCVRACASWPTMEPSQRWWKSKRTSRFSDGKPSHRPTLKRPASAVLQESGGIRAALFQRKLLFLETGRDPVLRSAPRATCASVPSSPAQPLRVHTYRTIASNHVFGLTRKSRPAFPARPDGPRACETTSRGRASPSPSSTRPPFPPRCVASSRRRIPDHLRDA